MNRSLVGLLLLPMVTAGADMSPELTAEKRLHEVLGTKSIEKDTRYGGRLTLIDVPESSRDEVWGEWARLVRGLERLATRDAIRVLAGFLDDERHIYEPGSDYGSATIAHCAISSLAIIRREHPKNIPGAPSPARAPDTFNSKAWSAWMESKDRLRINAWRKWWAANKASYEQAPSATPVSK